MFYLKESLDKLRSVANFDEDKNVRDTFSSRYTDVLNFRPCSNDTDLELYFPNIYKSLANFGKVVWTVS